MKLSKLASSGIKWASVSQVSKQVIQYVTTIIFVSLLEPTDFGLIAMAMVVIGFLEIFKDLGTSSAIIHLTETSKELLSSIFYVNIFFGLFISTMILIFSPLISEFYNNSNLISILNVLTISFFLSSLSIVQKSLLEKELSFNKISMIEVFSGFVGAISGIFLAFYNYGVWSLVFQSIINNLLLSLLFWINCNWKPSLLFKFKSIVTIVKYSSNLIGYNIFNYFVRNVDYLLIGKYLGDKELGYYYIAYKIMLYPVSNISVVISRVMFPIYSKIKDDLPRFRDIYLKIGNSIALITFPLMLLLFGANDLVAEVFFGKSWNFDLIAKLILILAPVGLVQSIASTTGSIYQATGKTDWMFRWGILSGIVYVSGFFIGIQYGVIGVALSYLVTTFLLLYPVFSIPFKIISLKFLTFIRSFVKIFIAAAVMIIIIYLLKYLIIGNIQSVLKLSIIFTIAVLTYSSIIFLIFKNQILEIVTILKS